MKRSKARRLIRLRRSVRPAEVVASGPGSCVVTASVAGKRLDPVGVFTLFTLPYVLSFAYVTDNSKGCLNLR